MKRKTIGIIGGSFDPITKGHEYLISSAAALFDELHVIIGTNPVKRHHFSVDERKRMIDVCVSEIRNTVACDIKIDVLENDLLINKATELNATNLVRGMRSIADFEYETQMSLVNRRINPNIGTIYIFPPPEFSEVSSSIVKGLVGFSGWENAVKQYVNPTVLDELTRKHKEKIQCAS